MKIMKNIIFTITMLIGAQGAMAMQLPSYWSAIKKEPASLTGMPADIKGHLISVIAQGDPETAAESVFSLAQTNKEFNILVNQLNSDYVIALLDGISDVPKAIKLVEKMQMADARLPILKNPAIQAWLVEAKESLIDPAARQLREWRIKQVKVIGGIATWLGIYTYISAKLLDFISIDKMLISSDEHEFSVQAKAVMALMSCCLSGAATATMPFAAGYYLGNRRN